MFKDVPTKIGSTFTGAWEQFWLEALPTHMGANGS